MIHLSNLVGDVRAKHILVQLYLYLPRVVGSEGRRRQITYRPHGVVVLLEQSEIYQYLTLLDHLLLHLIPRHCHHLERPYLVSQLLILFLDVHDHIRVINPVIRQFLVINDNQVTHVLIQVNESLKRVVLHDLEGLRVCTITTVEDPGVIVLSSVELTERLDEKETLVEKDLGYFRVRHEGVLVDQSRLLPVGPVYL